MKIRPYHNLKQAKILRYGHPIALFALDGRIRENVKYSGSIYGFLKKDGKTYVEPDISAIIAASLMSQLLSGING